MKRTRALTVFVLLVALVLAGSAPARAGKYTGLWKGKTEQGKPISFKVNSNNKITYLSVGWHINFANCSGSVDATTSKKFKPPLAIKPNHTFVAPMGNVTVTGEFISKKKAVGKVKVSYSDPTTGCAGSIKKKWHASKQ